MIPHHTQGYVPTHVNAWLCLVHDIATRGSLFLTAIRGHGLLSQYVFILHHLRGLLDSLTNLVYRNLTIMIWEVIDICL